MSKELYDLKAIKKELYKVVPERYRYFSVEEIFSHDISFYMSIRADGGKTTNGLLLGLVLYKLYKVRTIYLRNDEKQTTEANVKDMFDKIIKFGYLDKLFEIWNDVEYKRLEKSFYLCRREDGQIVEIDTEPFLSVRSNEKYKSYKSGTAIARAWFILWDEFLDSDQTHSTLSCKFFDNVTTFGREDPHVHVMALTNAVNKYDALFEDFTIADRVEFMDFGEKKSVVTDLGSRYFLAMIPVSVERLEKIKNKEIRFFGISKNKFAHLTGIQAWQGYNYQHLIIDRDGEDEIESNDLYGYIHHREKWLAIRVVTFTDDRKPIILITKSNPPRHDDYLVYTLNPELSRERLLDDAPKFILKAYDENRIYMSSNNIGLLFDDFLQENGYTPIKDKDRR